MGTIISHFQNKSTLLTSSNLVMKKILLKLGAISLCLTIGVSFVCRRSAVA